MNKPPPPPREHTAKCRRSSHKQSCDGLNQKSIEFSELFTTQANQMPLERSQQITTRCKGNKPLHPLSLIFKDTLPLSMEAPSSHYFPFL